MRRAAGEVETPGSRAKAGPIRASLAVLVFFVAPLLPAAAGAQEAADPVTGFAREPIHVASWPGGKKIAVGFALFVEEFGFGQGRRAAILTS
jgi:hypothetical protein